MRQESCEFVFGRIGTLYHSRFWMCDVARCDMTVKPPTTVLYLPYHYFLYYFTTYYPLPISWVVGVLDVLGTGFCVCWLEENLGWDRQNGTPVYKSLKYCVPGNCLVQRDISAWI